MLSIPAGLCHLALLPQGLHEYPESGLVVAVHSVVEGGEDEVHDPEDGDEERDHEQELELVDDRHHVGKPRRQEDARQGEEESRVAQEPVCEVEKPAPERDRTKSGKSPQQILNPVRGKFHKENFFKIKLRKVL